MPDAFEFPRMLCAIVPLVCGQGFAGFGRGVIDEFIAFAPREILRGFFRPAAGRAPGFTPIVRPLDDCPNHPLDCET